MATAFDVAMRTIFRDGNMATAAVWQAGGFGPEQAVQVIIRTPDVQHSWGEARIISSTSVLEVQTAVLAAVAEADTFKIAGTLYEVQGEPMRDEAGLVWKVEVRPR